MALQSISWHAIQFLISPLAAVLIYFPAKPRVPPTAISQIPRLGNIKKGVRAMVTNRLAKQWV